MPRLSFLLLTLLATLSAASLKSKIDEAIAASPSLANAFVGLEVVNLTDGRVLYEHNQDHLFVPASNMKLFTTALSLLRLGPHYRFTTLIGADRPIDAAGTLT